MSDSGSRVLLPVSIFFTMTVLSGLIGLAVWSMYPGAKPTDEVVSTFILNTFNGLVLLILSVKRDFGPGRDSLSISLGILVSKLFVNTLTLFVFIGLQAMDSRVCVPVFFAGYFLHLAGFIYGIHRNSTQERRQER